MYYTYALVKNTGNSYLKKKGRVGRKISGCEDKVKMGALGILLGFSKIKNLLSSDIWKSSFEV